MLCKLQYLQNTNREICDEKYHNRKYQPKGIELVIKDRNVSLSIGLKLLFGASDTIAPVTVVPEVVEAATGAATGLDLAEMLDIPMLPVKESNNPPTEGEGFTTTSGSSISPLITSPKACATINALK